MNAALGWLLGAVAGVGARLGSARERLEWLVRLRWFAVVGQVTALGFGRASGWLPEGSTLGFAGVVVALAGLNAVTGVWLSGRAAVRESAVALHLGVDIACLALLLLLSGGANNPMSAMLFLHASLGPILVRRWLGAVCFTSLLAAFVVVHLGTEPPAAAISLPSQVVVCTLVWALTWWLTARLAASRAWIDEMQARQSRMDKLRAVGALAAGFSHRFATPLNTLQMRLDRLARIPALEDNADLEAALAAAAQCEHVLGRMAGAPLRAAELRMEPRDLGKLVQRVCDQWGDEARSVEVEIEAGVPPCPMPELAFTQSLLNLLDNAAEAMDGAGRPEVRVRRADHGAVTVSVADRGAGWPDAVRDDLAQPFVTTRPNGVGLGLYNAASLADALGGRLELRDREGGGATVVFVIPSQRGGDRR